MIYLLMYRLFESLEQCQRYYSFNKSPLIHHSTSRKTSGWNCSGTHGCVIGTIKCLEEKLKTHSTNHSSLEMH